MIVPCNILQFIKSVQHINEQQSVSDPVVVSPESSRQYDHRPIARGQSHPLSEKFECSLILALLNSVSPDRAID